MNLAIAATVLALILPAELPDKTMFATLVLSTRFRPLPVWVGVAGAFAVQTGAAVLAGGLVALLPRRPVLAVTAALFALGAVLMARSGEEAAEEEQEVEAELSERSVPPTFRRVAFTSFGVLFAAEWGDLSQILTASLAARYEDPLSVFAGAWVALALIAGGAVLSGRVLVRYVPLRLVRFVAVVLFAVLAALTALEAAGIAPRVR